MDYGFYVSACLDLNMESALCFGLPVMEGVNSIALLRDGIKSVFAAGKDAVFSFYYLVDNRV
jgi:hypothetical protein